MEEPFEIRPEPVINEPVEGQTVPDGEVRQVKELLQSVLKTKRAFEMYPSNNPMLVKFQEDLIKKFESFLDSEDRLTLIVRQQDIYYKGAPVYHNADKDDNLALIFYKDGLRELTFTKGFSGDEVMDFVEVIRARPELSAESFDDDVATLLWEKDFIHLSYYVVEEFAEGSALEEDEVARILNKHKTSDGDLSEVYQDATEGEAGEAASDKEIFSPLEAISMGFKGVFSLGEEEVKSLKEEMEALTDEAFLQGAINDLFESLYLDKGTPDFDILMNNLDSALVYLLHDGGFGTAGLILKRFRELTGESDTFGKKEVERIKASLKKAGSEASVRTATEILNTGKDVSLDDFQFYLSQLEKSSVISLSNLMGDIQDIKYRKALIETIVVLGRDNIEVLASGLKDKRWQVVRNIVTILGRIGDKAALEHLKLSLKHPEPSVRREVVRALGMIGGPKAGDALLLAMDDQDPQIRMAALRFLPNAQSYAVLDNLMEIITRQDFSERALAEKRVLFEVLAEIGQDRVLPFMVKLLRKKALFGSAKKDEIRASAAYGLGNIHHQEALDALKKEQSGAKKGSTLYEAISYSIHKLSGQAGRSPEAQHDDA